MQHLYTTDSLPLESQAYIRRVPGLREVERLFPEPASVGKGSIGVEGGITIVGGPGMGKTSLLRRLRHRLETERRIAVAMVSLPPARRYPAEDGFYRFLGQIVLQTSASLWQSPLLEPAASSALRAVLAEPTWDGDGATSEEPMMTPRGLERWFGRLGAAARGIGGICLLLDDVDHGIVATWKNAFIAALRFTFQAASGITPVFASWSLYLDESLPGSNYFRNVTRPVFLTPLPSRTANGKEAGRRALIDLALPGLSADAEEQVYRLAGGHPKLLQQVLGDLCARLDAEGGESALTPAAIIDMLDGEAAERERALARELLSGSAALAATLRELSRAERESPYPASRLSRVIVASGLVDSDRAGSARVPLRVTEIL